MMLDIEEVSAQVQLTTLHQILVLDGMLQTVRLRLEEDMPLEQFLHLTCTFTELESQLLQWTHALAQWVEGDAAPDEDAD